MAESMEGISCSREGCPGTEEGCIEGLGLDCPNRHSFSIPQESIDVVEESIEDKTPPGTVKVHNGEAYTTKEADVFLRRKSAVVVAFLGCPDTGKTTAAVMLYELLKRRRLSRLGFAGSNTIRGFQKRSFKSLVASGLRTPDTDRTSGSSPVEFLHLRVCVGTSNHVFHDMLLSDRTGEDFEACIGKPDLCATYPEIPRADWHVLLIDGNKLIEDDKAALHASEVRKIFASLIKTPISNLQLVLTKFDKISKASNKEVAIQRFETLIEDLKKRAKDAFLITTHKLAARPSMDESLTGFGLEELVEEWFTPKPDSFRTAKYIPTLVEGTPYDLLLNTLQVK